MPERVIISEINQYSVFNIQRGKIIYKLCLMCRDYA